MANRNKIDLESSSGTNYKRAIYGNCLRSEVSDISTSSENKHVLVRANILTVKGTIDIKELIADR